MFMETFLLHINTIACVKAEISTQLPVSKLRYSQCSGIYTSHTLQLFRLAQANNVHILFINARRTKLHNINFIACSKAEI